MAPLNCCCSDASKRKCATPKPLANVFSYNVLFTRSWYRSAVCLYPNATRATYTINDTLAIKSSANADGELHRSSNLWLTRNAKSPANVARSSGIALSLGLSMGPNAGSSWAMDALQAHQRPWARVGRLGRGGAGLAGG